MVPNAAGAAVSDGTGGIRTPDRRFKKALLLPAELQSQFLCSCHRGPVFRPGAGAGRTRTCEARTRLIYSQLALPLTHDTEAKRRSTTPKKRKAGSPPQEPGLSSNQTPTGLLWAGFASILALFGRERGRIRLADALIGARRQRRCFRMTRRPERRECRLTEHGNGTVCEVLYHRQAPRTRLVNFLELPAYSPRCAAPAQCCVPSSSWSKSLSRMR